MAARLVVLKFRALKRVKETESLNNVSCKWNCYVQEQQGKIIFNCQLNPPGVDFSFKGSWAQNLIPNFYPPFWGKKVGCKSHEKGAQLFVKLCGL
jgi:hypothetical protein